MNIKYEVIITERAKQELKEIYDYISKSLMEENTADKLINKIEKELLQLEDIPEGFSVIEKYRKKDFEYRRLPINNYVAIYREAIKVDREAISDILIISMDSKIDDCLKIASELRKAKINTDISFVG